MRKIETYTTEMALEDANKYIIENNIHDEDTKQTLYLLALEFCNARNEGYKYSFPKFLERTSVAKEAIKEFIPRDREYDDRRVDLHTVYYDAKNTSYAEDMLLYHISHKLTNREQEMIYLHFVENKYYTSIAEAYNISTMRARDIINKALRKLRSANVDLKELNADIIKLPEFSNKFYKMLKGEYEPKYEPFKIGTRCSNYDLTPREKLVFYTKRELENKREKVDKHKIIKEFVKFFIKNCNIINANAFYFNDDLKDLDIINECIDACNEIPYCGGDIPNLYYMGIMDGKKYFNIKWYGHKYGLEAHFEGTDFVINGDDYLYGVSHHPYIETILKYIVTHYGEF